MTHNIVLVSRIDFISFCTYFWTYFWTYFYLFSNFLKYELRLLIWYTFSFLRYAFSVINFPLSTVSMGPTNFDPHVLIFIQLYIVLKIAFKTFSLNHEFFKSVLFGKYLDIFSLSFCQWFLVWFHCGQVIPCIVLIILNLVRFILWPKIWSVFVDGLWKKTCAFFHVE